MQEGELFPDHIRQLPMRKTVGGADIPYGAVLSRNKTTDPWSLKLALGTDVGPFFYNGTNKRLTHTIDEITGVETITYGAPAADPSLSVILTPSIVLKKVTGTVQLLQKVKPSTNDDGGIMAFVEDGTPDADNKCCGLCLGKMQTLSHDANSLPNKVTDGQYAWILVTHELSTA